MPWQNAASCNTSGLTFTPASTPGASVITHLSQGLTDNGPGTQATFAACVPGSPAQQWYIP
ncbi:hypothetical protein [Yinghuangia seranimata]|uniref:hypothetical protein n=1 Tax=Yinghuangia seranimata TaxID=408067 RepID=UPI00248CDCA5|nr:hypothetical protein [Yinghuangia seranimata]MDI2130099.1 hypothetical protein [Yinghuangia seranimata]